MKPKPARTFGRLAVMLALLLLAPVSCKRPAPTPPAPPAAPTIPLADAIRTGNLIELERFAAIGTDLNRTNAQGRTPLFLATWYQQIPVFDWLMERGADPRIADMGGMTPLHVAAGKGNLDLVVRLLQAPIDINARNRDNQSPAELAAALGREEILERLVAAGAVYFLPDIEVAEEAVAATSAKPKRITGDFRAWTSATGQKLEAEFVELIADTVTLRSPDDKLFRIHINKLSRDDQILARSLAAPTLASATVPGRTATRPEPGASLASRLTRVKGWTVLEDCRLISSGANDGDSFHVRHQGKEYIFRLYYVDAAETSNEFPDRVQEQARYFGLDRQKTLKLGKDASRFTEKVLGRSSFTVITRWEDARGSSSMGRNYAFVITPEGDLDELLAAAGLVRIYGMHIDGGLGKMKQRELLKLEQQAKSARLGAWSKSGALASPARP
jgi:ankyrin repeat protein/endonuclease YncB( thermonuclease family)